MPNDTTLDVSVIIPFKDKSDLTLTCLRTLCQYGEPVKEILLVSNNSSDAELKLVEDAAAAYSNARVLVYNEPFNFQKINNWAAQQATGKVLFLLNNDIEFTHASRSLLAAMYHKALEKTVGAVGAVLLYEDNVSIQHAGVYLLPGGTARHLYAGEKFSKVINPANRSTYPYDITEDLTVNAVTAAALMVEKKKFDRLHGMDESFIICTGDVDLCLRLKDGGLKSVLLGSNHGTLIHKESKSRGGSTIPYADYVGMYHTYIKHFDFKHGDEFLHWEKIKGLLHE